VPSPLRAVARCRTLALAPEQVASPLAGRPYDLRHAAVSVWLNGGVAAAEVANRAGHSVEVLLRVCAKCIDGGEESANRRIDEALRLTELPRKGLVFGGTLLFSVG
jgi:hypothetical protein